jgi:hypothetical protein
MKYLIALLIVTVGLWAVDPIRGTAQAGGPKIFIQPAGGLETYISAAIMRKKVPVTVVVDQEQAEYIVEVAAESQKAGWAKILVARDARSTEEASIRMIDAKSKAVVFAYAYHMGSSYRGKQSAAESCAKHLGQWLKAK